MYDIISIILASYLSILVRYEFHMDSIPHEFLRPITQFLPINIIMTIAIFWAFRMYHSLWAYAGETELQNRANAAVLSGV